MSTQTEYNCLRWQCRRGMLELDLLLLGFLDKNFSNMSSQDITQFKRLLTESDTLLQQWLIYNIPPLDPQMTAMVAHIKLNYLQP